MPVRQMTEEEKARFFGSGVVIFRMKRPVGSNTQQVGGEIHGGVFEIPKIEVGSEDRQLQGIYNSIPSPER